MMLQAKEHLPLAPGFSLVQLFLSMRIFAAGIPALPKLHELRAEHDLSIFSFLLLLHLLSCRDRVVGEAILLHCQRHNGIRQKMLLRLGLCLGLLGQLRMLLLLWPAVASTCRQ